MEKVIVSGFGGQGVLFAGKLLAFTGMTAGKRVSWIPSYGPEMRGGTANCAVIISDKDITSPIVNTCTALLALNGPSLEKFQGVVEPGGKVLFDSSIDAEAMEGFSPDWIQVRASEYAVELGAPGMMNMVMLGAFIRESAVFTLEELFAGMEEMLGGKKPELLEINRKAILAGYERKVGSHA